MLHVSLWKRGRGSTERGIGHMTKEEQLREIQKRIAEARGYTSFHMTEMHDGTLPRPLALCGVLHVDEGSTLVPRWPQEWCDAGVLVAEMRAADARHAYRMDFHPRMPPEHVHRFVLQRTSDASAWAGAGRSDAEAIARCWCAWKGIDLSDLT